MTLTSEKNKRLLTAISLTLILSLGAFLRLYELGAYSIGNTYYAATVKSMLTSWHNFFYAAFEPGGSVTVDKPPLGFWVQAIFAYFLGVNGFALALPQALAGVLSIGVLYHLVKKHFGAPAGLVAALVLAVTPVTVATERNNTIDGLLVFVLLLAAWAFLKAVESGKTRHVLLGAFLVGVGFNIKMLQAFMPLPAFYAVYFFGSRRPWGQRLAQLAAATVVLFVVSFAWVAAVDLTPPDERPYIGSSENNTVTELIIGHNGLRRLGLLQRGPGGNRTGTGVAGSPGGLPPQSNVPASPGDAPDQPRLNVPPDRPGSPSPPPEALAACENSRSGEACAWTRRDGQQVNGVCVQVPQGGLACAPPAVAESLASVAGQQPPQPGGSAPGGPGRSNETGQAGVLRLFQEPLVTEASWLLVFVLLSLPMTLLTVGWVWPLEGKQIGLLLWTAWLLPEMAYFSFTTGLFHRYYLIMLGPPLAALCAISLWSLARHARRRPALAWLLTALLAGMNILFEIYTIRSYPDYAGTVTALSLLLWLSGLTLLALRRPARQIRQLALGLVLCAVLVAPFSWSLLTTLNPSPNVALPSGGPPESDHTQATFMTPDQALLSAYEQRVLAYTLANTAPDSYLLATYNARQAAPFILETGRPVLTFGGFSGGDNIVSLEMLQSMIASGELRFILGLPQNKPELAEWIASSCRVVPGFEAPPQQEQRAARPAGRMRPGSTNEVLYDCGG